MMRVPFRFLIAISILGSVSFLSTVSAEEKPITVKAEDLTKAFEADEAAAKKKYHDKTVLVEGKVVKRTGFSEGLVTVVLAGKGKKQVECVFAITEEKEVLALKPGDQVKIEGNLLGSFGGTNKDTLSLNTCKLVK